MTFLFKQPKLPSVITPKPFMPTPLAPPSKEEEKKKIRRGAAGKTIATGPRGILTKAKVERKFLLGE